MKIYPAKKEFGPKFVVECAEILADFRKRVQDVQYRRQMEKYMYCRPFVHIYEDPDIDKRTKWATIVIETMDDLPKVIDWLEQAIIDWTPEFSIERCAA